MTKRIPCPFHTPHELAGLSHYELTQSLWLIAASIHRSQPCVQFTI